MNNVMKSLQLLMVIFIILGVSCTTKRTRTKQPPANIATYSLMTETANGIPITIEFTTGTAHNHPTFAVWTEEMDGTYIQTLFVTKSIATGIFNHGEVQSGIWKNEPGYVKRPATLPYWLHKKGQMESGQYLPDPQNPITDAITGATPESDFILKTKTRDTSMKKFRLLVEVNQTWDWNSYWHNNKYPENQDYKTSAQPALVYAVTIDLESPFKKYYLNPIGHSHYAGENGLLFTDISTLTSALEIFKKITVTIG